MDEWSVARDARQKLAGVNRNQPDGNEHGREPQTESDDQIESERNPMQCHGAQQDDESRRTRYDSARHPERHQLPVREWLARNWSAVLVMMMIPSVSVIKVVSMVMDVKVTVLVDVIMVVLVIMTRFMIVMMMRVSQAVMVMMTVAMRVSGVPLPQQVQAKRGNRKSGKDAEPWIEVVRNDVVRKIERDQAQSVNSCRVGRGHDQAQ